MSQTLNLYRLQQVDSLIDHLKNRLNDIQIELDNDAELRRSNQQVEVAEIHCQNAEQTLKKAEKNVQELLIKIEQTQSSLYGEKAHSPKELQDLQNEVAALKRYLDTLEDRQIDAMQEVETSETELQVAQANLKSTLDEREEYSNDLLREKETLKNNLERSSIERIAIAGSIPAAEIDLYEQLRQLRRGVAVAVISEKSCGACGSILSPAQIQAAHSTGQMMLCPSCGRILYGS